MKNPSDDIKVGYSDFVALFRVENPQDFALTLRIAFDGIWVRGAPSDLPLPSDVLSVLSEHPDGDPSKPVLSFPSSLGEIRKRLLPIYGDTFAHPDPYVLADFVATKVKSEPEAVSNRPVENRERATLLCIIGALVEGGNNIDLLVPFKAAEQISAILALRGVKVGTKTIGNHLKAVANAMGSRRP